LLISHFDFWLNKLILGYILGDRYLHWVRDRSAGWARFAARSEQLRSLFPPVLGVESPSGLDFGYWKRRRMNQKQRFAPNFWVDFYAEKFRKVISVVQLFDWGKLVGELKLMLSAIDLESLRKIYAQEKYLLEHF
jgi:hypothetical protein